MHRTYHMSRIPSLNRKVRVVVDWTLALFLRARGGLARPAAPAARGVHRGHAAGSRPTAVGAQGLHLTWCERAAAVAVGFRPNSGDPTGACDVSDDRTRPTRRSKEVEPRLAVRRCSERRSVRRRTTRPGSPRSPVEARRRPDEIGSGHGEAAPHWVTDGRIGDHLRGRPGRLAVLRSVTTATSRSRCASSRVPIRESASYSAVVALNVLEHIEDDVEALRDFARLVEPRRADRARGAGVRVRDEQLRPRDRPLTGGTGCPRWRPRCARPACDRWSCATSTRSA